MEFWTNSATALRGSDCERASQRMRSKGSAGRSTKVRADVFGTGGSVAGWLNRLNLSAPLLRRMAIASPSDDAARPVPGRVTWGPILRADATQEFARRTLPAPVNLPPPWGPGRRIQGARALE